MVKLFTIFRNFVAALLLFSGFLTTTLQAQTVVRYVRTNGSGNGSSWTNASNNLQMMINQSKVGDEVWVSAGTYVPIWTAVGYNAATNSYPTTNGGRYNAFVLKTGVKIYGGFPATGTPVWEERDWFTYPSILSGDINGNDIPGNLTANKTDNCSHVLIGANIPAGSNTVIDGFSIIRGTSVGGSYLVNGRPISSIGGAGMVNVYSSPTISNVTISENTGNDGGGVRNENSSPTFINVTISGNRTTDNGGGLCDHTSATTYVNVVISGNHANNLGGGIHIYGRLSSSSETILTNVTICGNRGGQGSGICFDNGKARICNSIIYGNYGSNVSNYGGSSYVFNNSVVYGLTAPGILKLDPIFVNPINGSAAPTTAGDYSLPVVSPTINAGNNLLYLQTRYIPDFTGETDRAGNPRLIDGTIDLGAYELLTTLVPLTVNLTSGDSKVILAPQPPAFGYYFYYTYSAAPATPPERGTPYTAISGITQYTSNINIPGANGVPIYVQVYRVETAGQTIIGFGEAVETPVAALAPINGIIYIDHTKNGTGYSWENAYPNLADPLIIAAQQRSGDIPVAATDTIRAIFVAEGTYYPMHTANGYHFTNKVFPTADEGRDNAFVLVAGVEIYGGFVPAEIPADIVETGHAPSLQCGATGRNGETILSGDIGTPNDNTDNCHHILIGVDIPAGISTVMDGFIITGGNADGSGYISINGTSISRNSGGGISNYNSSPTLSHITFSGNRATDGGGGIYNTGSSPTLTHITISGNRADDSGGGIRNTSSSPTLTNLLISGNSAPYGGGIFNTTGSSPTLTNITISGNSASNGGGIYNANSTPQINNCIIWGNLSLQVRNVNSTPLYNHCLVGGETVAGGIISNDDPQFVNWIDPSSATMPNTLGDYRLELISPVVNMGGNQHYLDARNISDFTGETDLAGNPRLEDGSVDLGAYEYQGVTPDINGVVYVDYTKTGEGSSWENAYPNLAYPLIIAAQQRSGAIYAAATDTIRAIYVAEGTYYPMYTAVGYHFNNKIFPKTDGDRNNAFILVAGVKIYGGFVPEEIPVGAEDFLPLQFGEIGRNGVTTLSGDIGILGDISDNCHHVVIGVSIPECKDGECPFSTLMDGFTISDGNADVAELVSVSGMNINKSIGGGMFNYSASPVLSHITFSGNRASTGGGIYNTNYSSSTLTCVTISGNSATNFGGGIYNAVNSSPVLANVTLSGNSASSGGGIYNNNSSPVLANVTLSGNRATTNGGGIFNTVSSSPEIYNSIIWGNSNNNVFNSTGVNLSVPVYDHSLVGGVTIGDGIISNDDPLFVEWIDPSSATMPNTDGDYSLQTGSPAINVGNNDLYLSVRGITDFTGETDLTGTSRLLSGVIDLGAYESQVVYFFPDINGIVYVDSIKSGDGSSWENAYPNLADPLIFAAKQRSGIFPVGTTDTIKAIYVAEGTYFPMYTADGYNFCKDGACPVSTFPDTDGEQDNAFVLVEGVKIYGGFVPEEIPAEAENFLPLPFGETGRNGVSILSGEIGTGNVNHILIGINISNDGNTVIDGFTLSGGYAQNADSIMVNETMIYRYKGGGIYNYQASPTLANVMIIGNGANFYGAGIYNDNSSPTLTDVTLSENIAYMGGGIYNDNSSPTLSYVNINGNIGSETGGGIYNDNSSPTLTNVTINGNSTENLGGGMYNDSSSPTLIHVTISGNSANGGYIIGFGGGMYNINSSSPTLTDVSISENIVSTNGGGIYNNGSVLTLTNVTLSGNRANINGGGIYNNYCNSAGSSILTNVIITGNSADTYNGGGIYNNNSTPILTNVTISGNSSNISGGGMFNTNVSSPRVYNSIIWGNSAPTDNSVSNELGSVPVYGFSLVEDVTETGIISHADPLFVNWIDPSSNPVPNVDGDYNLSTGSPAINAGGNQYYLDALGILDFTGETDLAGNSRVFGFIIDLGAYENQTVIPTLEPLTVNLTPDDGRVILSPQTPATGYLFYYTYSAATATPPSYGDAISTITGATAYSANTDISGMNGTVIFVQVYKVEMTGSIIIGYGEANETPTAMVISDINGIAYVDHTKTGDGSSWTNAYPDLAYPLIIAAKQRSGAIQVAATDTIKAIYVAEGTYYPMYTADGYNFCKDGACPISTFPDVDGGRDNAFVLVEGVEIYGGFVPDEIPVGAENFLPLQFGETGRNGTTTLSGDIGIANDNSDNCHHVVISIGIPASSNTVIDGFTITGGNANGTGTITTNSLSINRIYGGGIYNVNNSSPAIANVTISGNSASSDGGGIYNTTNSSPVLTNVTFSGNLSNNNGGGIYIATNSSPTLVNVTLSGNSATNGGGIYNATNSSPNLVNVTISGNRAISDGGGIYNAAWPILYNSIIWGNIGNNVYNNFGIPVYDHSLIEDATVGGGIISNADPLFVNWIDPSSATMPNTLGDYNLQTGSPAINTGDNDLYLTARGISDFTDETDLAGNPRLFGTNIDLGSFENQAPPPPISVTGISLDEHTWSMEDCDTKQLTATITPSDAANQDVVWSSDDTSIAIVDQTGLVIGVAPGTVTITVTADDGGFYDECAFTVTACTAAGCPSQKYDIANNIWYDVVELAGLCWFKENLRNTKYADGSEIPYDPQSYNNLLQNEIDFGLLYTYESLTSYPTPLTSICPAGWRIPTAAEWELLNTHDVNELNNSNFWLKPNPYNNSTEFDIRGAGFYNSTTGRFEKLYAFTAFWSSDFGSGENATVSVINFHCNQIELSQIKKTDALSVRCVME